MEKKDRLKGLSTRCEEIQEIMGRPPGWMLRWGILVIFLIVCALLIGCYFIHLPQTLPIKVYARTDIQSDSTFAKSNGQIASIMKSNSTVITKGDTILSCSNDTCMDYITSSLSGKLSYPNDRCAGDKVKVGEVLFYIDANRLNCQLQSCYGFLSESEARQVQANMPISIIVSENNDKIIAKVKNIASHPNESHKYYMEVFLNEENRKKLNLQLNNSITELNAQITIASPRLIEKFKLW